MPTSITAIARQMARVLLPLAMLAGCGRAAPSDSVPVVDLIKEYARADARPANAYALGTHTAGGRALPSINGPAPGRLTWSLPLPRHGSFRAELAASAAPVRVRIGISDTRIYEQLAAIDVPPDAGWTVVTADLSAYAGWKLSLFYRPERQVWRLNLSADAPGGNPGAIAWGNPEILAPLGADAREYAQRRLRITRSEAP